MLQIHQNNKKIKHFHESCLRLIQEHKLSSYKELLEKGGSVSANNKNVIPSKYILVFDIQLKNKMCKMLKINLCFKMFTISFSDYKMAKCKVLKLLDGKASLLILETSCCRDASDKTWLVSKNCN